MRGGRCLKGRGDDTREGCCHDGMGGGWHEGRAMPRWEGNGMRAERWHAAVENAVRGCRVVSGGCCHAVDAWQGTTFPLGIG